MNLRILLVLVVSCSIISASETTHNGMRIPKSAILGKSALGKARLMRDEEGFKVIKKGKSFPIDPTLVEAPLRAMNDEQLGKYLAVAKIAVSKTSDKNFVLRTHVPGQGGGVVGATIGAWAGYCGVQAGALGIAKLISLPFAAVNPALGFTVYAGCAVAAKILAQPVAVAAGVAGGITVGTLTGPV